MLQENAMILTHKRTDTRPLICVGAEKRFLPQSPQRALSFSFIEKSLRSQRSTVKSFFYSAYIYAFALAFVLAGCSSAGWS